MAIFEEIYLMLLNSIITFLPKLLACIIVLIIGLILGKITEKIVKEIITRSTIEKYISRSENLNISLSSILSLIFKWIVYLVFIQQAAIYLGVTAIIDFINRVILFIPGLVEAIIIIIVGYVIASYIKQNIIGSRNIYSNITGQIIFLLIVYLSVATGIKSISGINTMLLDYVLLVILFSFGLGIAIAVGLGLKDVVSEISKEILEKELKKKKFK
ncbi:MAG: hypothetical protein KQA40_00775 [Candidatus Aenigmarchaeota archaeon]|nr:hypothetical protein [Candidatus Aenigmarchaeota archaeon]